MGNVSNLQNGEISKNTITGLNISWQARAVGNGSVTVLSVDAAPIQYITPAGAATIRLPLAAKDGAVQVIKNVGAGGALAITDDAGTPNAVGSLAVNTSGWFQKRGKNGVGVWDFFDESAAIA